VFVKVLEDLGGIRHDGVLDSFTQTNKYIYSRLSERQD